MRVLVSGDKGFIGSKTALALAALGHPVGSADKKSGISTAHAELFELRVKSFKPDLIVHMGASCSTRISIEKPAMDFTDNAVGTFNVAEVARTHGSIPVLYTSTCKVEAGADGLVAPLGLSKKVGEEYLNAYRKLFGLPVVILQPSTIYGPGQKGDRNLGWVSHFIRCAVEGAQPVVYGTGEQTRDILYIDDFIRLIVDIVENFEIYEGQTYPVGGGAENEVSLNTLLHHLGLNQYTRQPAMPSDLVQVVQDNSLISSVNGWSPSTHWKSGVQKTRVAM